MHVRRLALATATIALLASGCFKADVDLDVKADRTVDGTVLLAYRRDALAAQDRAPADAQADLLKDLSEDRPTGLVCEPFEDEATIGARCTLVSTPFDEFNATDTFGQDLTISGDGDRIRVTGAIDLTQVRAGQGSEGFDARIRMMFPGDVVDQENGTVEGRTVTWRPSPGQRLEIRAVAEASAAGPPAGPAATSGSAGSGDQRPGWLVVALLAFVAGVALGWVGATVVGRSRGRRAPGQ